jgi:hypothetical protein
MKHKVRVITAAVVLVLALLCPAVAVAQLPPIVINGSVTVGGSSAPDGMSITAWVGATQVGSAATSGGAYAGMIIQPAWRGSTALFRVDGVAGGQAVIHATDAMQTVNLEVYTLTVNINPPAGGSVGVTPTTGPYPSVPPLTNASLDAQPNAGFVFVQWTGDLTGSADPANLLMNGNKNVTAHFNTTPVVEYWLTISTEGCGDVTTPGEGTFGPYSPGDTQNLVADPCDCWRFTRWEGDVTTVANVDRASTSITMNGDYDIVAVFDMVEGGLFPSTVTARLQPGDCITVEKRVEIVTEDDFDALGRVLPRVRLEVITRGFEDWVDFDPSSQTYEPPCDVVYFDEEICVPPGTPPGRYTFIIRALGDRDQLIGNSNGDLEFGDQQVIITVPEELLRPPAEAEEPPNPVPAYLLIIPDTVVPNQEVEISINIGNDGGSVATRSVALYINGEVEQSQTVAVSPGSAKNVVFRVTKAKPGVYNVWLEGNEGQFTVVAPAKARYLPGPLGTPGIIVIVVVAIVLIGAIVFIFVRKEEM